MRAWVVYKCWSTIEQYWTGGFNEKGTATTSVDITKAKHFPSARAAYQAAGQAAGVPQKHYGGGCRELHRFMVGNRQVT